MLLSVLWYRCLDWAVYTDLLTLSFQFVTRNSQLVTRVLPYHVRNIVFLNDPEYEHLHYPLFLPEQKKWGLKI